MEEDSDKSSLSRRLAFSRENFDDYFVALTAKLRSDVNADQVIFGELQHPLIRFQQTNQAALQQLNVEFVFPATLFADPVTPYSIFIHQLTNALLRAPAPIPDIQGLDDLQAAQATFRKAETHIYTTIVDTLRVGKSMHYVRQVKFGAGQLDNSSFATSSTTTALSLLARLWRSFLHCSLSHSTSMKRSSNSNEELISSYSVCEIGARLLSSQNN